ncbi:response regulator transcription factor [Pragia fontium]|uniref:Two component transcriptional regulator, LuxR family n=2 Tax=Pragia fontium TaxID=82985 RepID=A0AAJ4WBF4_9GAMM|nr:response regulator transcription factor [Pragia fontium]GKX61794.1 DNA-binding response regulator [Pragia fontium]SFC99436.1 two component transcriptional regulator, LuxR family [Pragia fontium DSM 5563 = ATCC 49100]SUB82409.1 Virulence factors putative positive transcription regulator BvgA [Pragia fontium]VEJ55311.1 Virulence factors putative positive transcription regulator BvgA [Pragia fontium]
MDKGKIKTLIVDNNQFVCFAISEILKNTDFLDIVGAIHSTSGVVDMIKNQDIQLVLINIDLINKDKLVKEIHGENASTKIIGLTSENSNSNIINSLDVSIDGIIDKTHDIESLTLVSKLVMNGFQCIPKNKLCNDKVSKTATLTNREREILQFITQGLSNKDIAEKLNISSKTVSVHRYNIMFKLEIKNSLDLFKLGHFSV